MSDESSSTSPPTNESTPQLDRPALLEKARAFLLSPGIRNEDEAAKRKFLEEKGLNGEEIDTLIRDLPPRAPPIPPRTYPLPPPSNLPVLLASLFRAITWLTGATTVLIFCYYRFILPRLIRSLGARHKLKLHQAELMGRLQGRIDQLKSTQGEVYHSMSLLEDEEPPADTKALEDLPVNSAGEPTHSLGVIVRSTFLGESARKLTLEEIYQRLLEHFPGLKLADEAEYKHFMLRELSRSRTLEKIAEGDVEYWSLRQDVVDPNSPPTPTYPTPPMQSLQNLRDKVSQGQRKPNAYQHTFKSLTDLTGYLSRETYSTTSGFRYGLPGTQPLNPAEEDVRREIRALKGLVLNRRTFAQSPYRSSPALATSATITG